MCDPVCSFYALSDSCTRDTSVMLSIICKPTPTRFVCTILPTSIFGVLTSFAAYLNIESYLYLRCKIFFQFYLLLFCRCLLAVSVGIDDVLLLFRVVICSFVLYITFFVSTPSLHCSLFVAGLQLFRRPLQPF